MFVREIMPHGNSRTLRTLKLTEVALKGAKQFQSFTTLRSLSNPTTSMLKDIKKV